MRRGSRWLGTSGIGLFTLGFTLLAQLAGAQVQPVCNGEFDILSSTGTESFGVPGSEYQIVVGIGSGPITDPDGGGPLQGQLTVNLFRYSLDCAVAGSIDLCTDEGNIIGLVAVPSIPDPNDGNTLKAVVGSSGCTDDTLTKVEWSAAVGANQVQFLPNSPVVLAQNQASTVCQVTFKVVVLNSPGSADGSPITIQQAGGASSIMPDWTCNNAAMSTSALGSNAIELCEVCGPDAQCASFACDPNDPRPRAGGGGLCEPDFVLAGTECRGTAGLCDPPEFCTGASTDCPADAKQSAGTICRLATDVCDIAEVCDGVGNLCPADQGQPVNTVCRAAQGVCDEPEVCDGADPACPADRKRTTLCRAAAGPCDIGEFCDGVANSCPANGFLPAGSVCRAAQNFCDIAEVCRGNTQFCPADQAIPRCGC